MKLEKKQLGVSLILVLFVGVTMVMMLPMVNVASALPDTYFFVDPPEVKDIPIGGTFLIKINVTGAPDTYAWEIYLSWDPDLLELVYKKEGDFLHRWAENPFPPPDYIRKYETSFVSVPFGEANVEGEIIIGCSLIGEVPWASGNGWLASLGFLVEAEGSSVLNLFNTRLYDYILAASPASTYYPNLDGFFYNEPFHDIAVDNVAPDVPEVYVGDSVTINVTVTNEGNYTETSENFNVTVYADTIVYEYEYDTLGRLIKTTIVVGDEITVGTQTLTEPLAPDATTNLTFTWNTTGIPEETYTISAEAMGDDDTRDNLFIDGNVTVQRLPGWPVANFTYSPEKPLLVNGEAKVTFNSTSYDEDGYIVSWDWDFNDDGIIDATTENATWVYTEAGDYVVRLIVNDNDTLTPPQDVEKAITVYAPPVANFTYSPEEPMSDEAVTFNATDSDDSDGSIVSYTWDFGDDTSIVELPPPYGVIVTHSYADDGVYTVTLNLTDNDGLSNITSADITVLNRPPVANFTESAETVDTGVVIHFNATDSYDPDGSIMSYFWDFGDETNATGMTVAHAYADDGVYTVTLTVTDDDEETGTATSTKTVLNRPPVANFTESAETVDTGVVIHFNATDSYDPDGSIVSYFWDFGDGTNATGVTVDHAYADDGTYNVTLTVTDDDGASSSLSATKTVKAPASWSLVWYAVIGLGIAALTLITFYALYRRRKE